MHIKREKNRRNTRKKQDILNIENIVYIKYSITYRKYKKNLTLTLNQICRLITGSLSFKKRRSF